MQGPGNGPYTSTAQGQSVGTWGRDLPVLLGSRVMETPPQCLAPSAKRERQALGTEGYTEVLRVGRFPQTAPPPARAGEAQGEWAQGPRGSRPKSP